MWLLWTVFIVAVVAFIILFGMLIYAATKPIEKEEKEYKIGDTVCFETIDSLVIEEIFDYNGLTYLHGCGKTVLAADVLDDNNPYVIAYKKKNEKNS